MEPMVNKGVVLVYGDSMLPRLRGGELVHIDKKTGYHVGEVVVFDVGHFCVHRIVAKIGIVDSPDLQSAMVPHSK